MNRMMTPHGHCNRPPLQRQHHWIGGLMLIAGGILLALANLGQLAPHLIWQLLIAMLALSALLRIATARRFYPLAKGVLRLALAIWLYACLEQHWGLTFHNSWPVLLILLGCRITLRGLFQRRPLAQEITS